MGARNFSWRETVMYGPLVTIRMILSDQKFYRLWQFRSERRSWTTGSPQLRVSTGGHTHHSDFELFFEMLAEAAA